MIDQLPIATDNAVAMWLALAAARGYEQERGDGFVCVTGSDRVGRRILTVNSTPDVSAIADRVAGATGRLVVEDSYGELDVPALTTGLSSRQMPVMVRHAKHALPAASMPVRRVRTEPDLRLAERLIVTGFTLDAFEPYQPGLAFPTALLDNSAVAFFVADRDGAEPGTDAAGACLTVTESGVTGFYWVTTMPDHRSRGVGRALMNGAITDLGAETVTLTASKAGRPLYESMAFDIAGWSTWWS
jgi:GNAT superfamily N-acetyltransferase